MIPADARAWATTCSGQVETLYLSAVVRSMLRLAMESCSQYFKHLLKAC